MNNKLNFRNKAQRAVAILLLLGISACSHYEITQQTSSKPIYFGAKFEPPAGRALHGWGQFSHGWNTHLPGASGDMSDYLDYETTVAPMVPAVVSFYLHPQRANGDAQLNGFIEQYKTFAKESNWVLAQIAYDFDPEKTLSGEGDAHLEKFFRAMSEVGKPVLMRIGWEFNNRGHFDPVKYREGFKYIVDKMRSMGVDNIATLWHASVPDLNEITGLPILSPHDYMGFYPGDEYVDWWSISEFSIDGFRSPGSVDFYTRAAKHNKPVFIGESAPWFGEVATMTFRNPTSLDESKEWFEAYFRLFEDYPQIKGMNLIILDWQRWNWIWPQIKGGFNNTRLDVLPELPAYYRDQLSHRRFIHGAEAKKLYLDAD